MATSDQRNRELHLSIERERGRIARDLHDGVAQQLALVLLKLEYLQRILEEPAEATPASCHSTPSNNSASMEKVRVEVGRAYTLLYESLCDLRHCISSLLPVQMERKSFLAALQELVYAYEDARYEISSILSDVERIPATLEVPLFRFVQEALSNARKHAQATRITICLSIQDDALHIAVSDNGRGFWTEQILHETDGRSTHIGLQCMRERISEAGGEWGIESRPEDGTRVWAHFPL